MTRYSKAKHSKSKRKYIQALAIMFLGIIIATFGYYIYYLHLSNQNRALYDEINEIKQEDEVQEKINNIQKTIKLKEQNSEVVGWIQIDNTNINYPLLQSNNNDYYLTHNYKKEKSKYGSIFLRSECNLSNENSNIIIYGHNMEDKQMFYSLLKYMDKSNYEKNKTIKIATDNEERSYTIVAVFKSKVFYEDEEDVFKYYQYTNFSNEEEYNKFIKNCKNEQLYDTGESAEYGEQLITLVTCEYSQKNGRFVVVAKRTN